MFRLSAYEAAKKVNMDLAGSISSCMGSIIKHLGAIDFITITINELPAEMQQSIKNVSKKIKISTKPETSVDTLLKDLGEKLTGIEKELEVMLTDREYKKFINEKINVP